MLYSLTDKLKFDEKPQIEVNGKVLTIDNSAVTVQNSGELAGTKAVIELLFNEKDRKVIEKLGLSVGDYIKFCEICMDLALGNDPDHKEQGEV